MNGEIWVLAGGTGNVNGNVNIILYQLQIPCTSHNEKIEADELALYIRFHFRLLL